MESNLSENLIVGKDINKFIKEHIPFIIKNISDTTGKYVSIENDEEFSIGILAFKEAIDKYEESKGAFPSFAQLVIKSRVKTYLTKVNKIKKEVSLNSLMEAGIDIGENEVNIVEDKEELINEIDKFKKELATFSLTMDDLVDEAPKHEDTRKNAINISKKVCDDDDIKNFMFLKKRLPIKQISLKYTITEKVLKGSKKFIISVVIIINKPYRNLMQWIK
ncbi:MAG: RNA polymerase subunit sigma [Clostridium sp.]